MSPRRLLPLCALLGLFALSGSPAHAAYPGVNGNLLFMRCGAGCSTAHLDTVGADGSEPFELLPGSPYDEDPAYSADGSRIAFSRCEASCGIAMAGADGSNPHKLVDASTGDRGQAEFSPDGSKIAYIDPSDALAVANADGSGTAHEIDTPPSGWDALPDWSPDGSRIVFSRGGSGADWRVWAVPSDGAHLPSSSWIPAAARRTRRPWSRPTGRSSRSSAVPPTPATSRRSTWRMRMAAAPHE